MSQSIPFITGVSGLNTVVDPVRVQYSAETGVSDLSVAINITIDDTGRPKRRTGYSKAIEGNYHSLFCDGGDCFVVEDRQTNSAIYRVGTDLSLAGVRSGLSLGKQIAFLQVQDETYYCNGVDNGIIKDGVSDEWLVGKYVGPETNRQFTDIPIGEHLAWFNGRIFISSGGAVYWSELFKYGLFDRARSVWQVGKKVLMIKPVEAGIFISDDKATWFYRGGVPSRLESVTKVAAYPAIEWSDAIDYIEGADIGLEPGLCALWASPEGACIGTSSGQFINMNKEKVIYPSSVRQGAGLLQGYHFIHTMR